jgi:actin-like ATPase involved in cell morphogenesis
MVDVMVNVILAMTAAIAKPAAWLIIDEGIIMTGGGSLLPEIDRVLQMKQASS